MGVKSISLDKVPIFIQQKPPTLVEKPHLGPAATDSVHADLPKDKVVAEMSVKELMQAIAEVGLEIQSVGCYEKSEFVLWQIMDDGI